MKERILRSFDHTGKVNIVDTGDPDFVHIDCSWCGDYGLCRRSNPDLIELLLLDIPNSKE